MYIVEVKKFKKTRQRTDCDKTYAAMINYGFSLREAQIYLMLLDGKTKQDIQTITGLKQSTVNYFTSIIRSKTKSPSAVGVVNKKRINRYVKPILKKVIDTIELPIGVNKLCLK